MRSPTSSDAKGLLVIQSWGLGASIVGVLGWVWLLFDLFISPCPDDCLGLVLVWFFSLAAVTLGSLLIVLYLGLSHPSGRSQRLPRRFAALWVVAALIGASLTLIMFLPLSPLALVVCVLVWKKSGLPANLDALRRGIVGLAPVLVVVGLASLLLFSAAALNFNRDPVLAAFWAIPFGLIVVSSLLTAEAIRRFRRLVYGDSE